MYEKLFSTYMHIYKPALKINSMGGGNILFRKENVSGATLSKGHADSLLEHKKIHDYWFNWEKCNCNLISNCQLFGQNSFYLINDLIFISLKGNKNIGIYIYIYIYIYILSQTHILICRYIYIYIYICMCVCILLCMSVSVCVEPSLEISQPDKPFLDFWIYR